MMRAGHLPHRGDSAYQFRQRGKLILIQVATEKQGDLPSNKNRQLHRWFRFNG
ncbi:unnamed protein product [Cylicostephanus goldi]|uniref:Uncharacterized protein n=1 Tax=Cylicostephanus goldi TaxID=71465 RepID=A0A3P6RVC9_CYLGO|nr:unnamed protein product [Cylicostephanus goldi]